MRPGIIAMVLLGAGYAAAQQFDSVVVPPAMLHNASAIGRGYTGKVEYYLNAGDADSVFVTLQVVPEGDGNPLSLSAVEGDVGLVSFNLESKSEKKSIFFEYTGAASGTYKAVVRAVAVRSVMERFADSLLSKMSVEDKIYTCAGHNGAYQAPGAGGVSDWLVWDGPHGVFRGAGAYTLYPCCSGMACTWNRDLIQRLGHAMAKEFRAAGKNWQLGPGLNLVYHPRGGRSFEYYSEDPYLTGEMTASQCRGAREEKILTTVKHYVANQKEANRTAYISTMTERSLQELFMWGFRKGCTQGCSWGVMTSYNRLNSPFGTSQDRYALQKVMRDEWNYKGLVMTDWTASSRYCNQDLVKWGADLEMPEQAQFGAAHGMDESYLDAHVRRRIRAGYWQGNYRPGFSISAGYDFNGMKDAHDALVLEAAREVVVLAKNINNILPLPKSASVFVDGPFANSFRSGGGGSSEVDAWKETRIRDEISRLGVTLASSRNDADYVIVVVGAKGEREGGDRADLNVDGDDVVRDAISARGAGKVVTVYTGGSASLPANWDKADGVLTAFFPGQQQGTAVAEALFGEINPSGKLPVTFPADNNQLPGFTESGNSVFPYTEAHRSHGYFLCDALNSGGGGGDPLFCFGHGLSYTTFEYGNVGVFPEEIRAGDRVYVSVDVTNTGSRAGGEVVQLYLAGPAQTHTGHKRRVKDLRGFEKVYLEQGESKTVTFVLGFEEMMYYDPGAKDYYDVSSADDPEWSDGTWRVDGGGSMFSVLIGSSSRDIRQQSSFTVTGDDLKGNHFAQRSLL